MKRTSSSYEPRSFGIPSIVIAVMWIMLWFLWPHGEFKALRRQPAVFAPRIALVKGVDNLNLKSFSFDISKSSTNDNGGVVAVPWMVNRPLRILEKKVPAGEESAVGKTMHAGALPLFTGMEGYTPVWDDVPVFNSRPDGVMRLTIEPMGALRDYGFQVPAFMPALKKQDKPWLVTVLVEIDEGGRVDNVFLDSGCENREINSIVVRSMYRGTLSKPGNKCEGRVKVNFGAN